MTYPDEATRLCDAHSLRQRLGTSYVALRQNRKAAALDPNKSKHYDDPNPSDMTIERPPAVAVGCATKGVALLQALGTSSTGALVLKIR